MKPTYEVRQKTDKTNIVIKISIEELVFEWDINGTEDGKGLGSGLYKEGELGMAWHVQRLRPYEF